MLNNTLKFLYVLLSLPFLLFWVFAAPFFFFAMFGAFGPAAGVSAALAVFVFGLVVSMDFMRVEIFDLPPWFWWNTEGSHWSSATKLLGVLCAWAILAFAVYQGATST